jgi:Eph receptor B1
MIQFSLSLTVYNESSMQNRLVAGATVLIVFIVVLAIVGAVLVLRTKNQDDLDKKTSNHLPLPLDYASNEGLLLICSP